MFDSNITKTDSLSKKIFEQIEVLQEVTSNQIEITDKQLITTKKLVIHLVLVYNFMNF